MKTESIKEELRVHIEDHISYYDVDDIINDQDLHHQIFNTDYYVIGRWHAEQWLKKHNVSVFEAIEFVQEYEKDNFGETQTYTDAEKLVNMITYIIGEELIYDEEYHKTLTI